MSAIGGPETPPLLESLSPHWGTNSIPSARRMRLPRGFVDVFMDNAGFGAQGAWDAELCLGSRRSGKRSFRVGLRSGRGAASSVICVRILLMRGRVRDHTVTVVTGADHVSAPMRAELHGSLHDFLSSH